MRFWLWAFKVWPRQFFQQKTDKTGQKVILFFLKNWDKIGPWFFYFWIAGWRSFVRASSLFDFGLRHGEKRGQSWTKTEKNCKLWVRHILIKIRIFRFFENSRKSVLLSLSNNCGAIFSKIRPHLGELRPNPPRKWVNFMDATLPRKHFNFFNFTTRYAIKMKLTHNFTSPWDLSFSIKSGALLNRRKRV